MEAVRGGFWHMGVVTRTFETSERLAKFIGGPEAAKLDLNWPKLLVGYSLPISSGC